MKSRPSAWIAAMSFVVATALPVQLAAQGQSEFKEREDESPRYKLIDLGTFGGPASYYSEAGLGSRVLNNRGDVAGYADTSIPDPSAPNCFNLDCFVSHTFRWRNGVRTDLGAFPGVNGSAASAINGRGWIVGFSEYGPIDPLTGSPHAAAALWRDGQMINLGTLEGGADSNAVGVNDRGQIVGFASNLIPDPFDPFGFPTQLRTFLWENGVMRDIGTLGGPDALPGTGINNRGQVTGSSYVNFVPNPSTGFPTADPFLWEDGDMIDLGSFGGTNGGGLAVNNRGQVIGQSNLAGDVETHAFLWNHGILTDLKTLGGTLSVPIWLNEAGEVVGGSTIQGDQIYQAFLWKNGVMLNLGTVDGDPCSQGNSINEKGQVVGISATCDFFTVQHAFLFEKGSMFDLNNLIPSNSSLQLFYATDINNRGEIVGVGVPPGSPPNPDLFGHLFVLIPCDDDHGDTGGCEGNNGVRSDATQDSSAALAQAQTTGTQSNLTPSELRDRVRAMLSKRNHGGFRSLPPK